ncbi:hypothetical protein EYF80_060289 [Liparis tanakae]|uniref:Uncharacterized protein n=1 Tax=Liparis tanakae TaxID=230148 RepID=A0A4Z2EMH1_9TELE|nr:hypothetical protein EYF80_060289 [Liparis tanakae]
MHNGDLQLDDKLKLGKTLDYKNKMRNYKHYEKLIASRDDEIKTLKEKCKNYEKEIMNCQKSDQQYKDNSIKSEKIVVELLDDKVRAQTELRGLNAKHRLDVEEVEKTLKQNLSDATAKYQSDISQQHADKNHWKETALELKRQLKEYRRKVKKLDGDLDAAKQSIELLRRINAVKKDSPENKLDEGQFKKLEEKLKKAKDVIIVLEVEIKHLTFRDDYLSRELKQEEKKSKQFEGELQHMKADVYRSVQLISDITLFKRSIIDLHNRYCDSNTSMVVHQDSSSAEALQKAVSDIHRAQQIAAMDKKRDEKMLILMMEDHDKRISKYLKTIKQLREQVASLEVLVKKTELSKTPFEYEEIIKGLEAELSNMVQLLRKQEITSHADRILNNHMRTNKKHNETIKAPQAETSSLEEQLQKPEEPARKEKLPKKTLMQECTRPVRNACRYVKDSLNKLGNLKRSNKIFSEIVVADFLTISTLKPPVKVEELPESSSSDQDPTSSGALFMTPRRIHVQPCDKKN